MSKNCKLEVRISEQEKQQAKEQAESKGFKTVSDLVRHLLGFNETVMTSKQDKVKRHDKVKDKQPSVMTNKKQEKESDKPAWLVRHEQLMQEKKQQGTKKP